MAVRGVFFALLTLGAMIAVGRAQSAPFETGRMGWSEYENVVAGRGSSRQVRTVNDYLLGLLTAIERTLADERDQGRKPPFCLPAHKVLNISDLHATIQAEVKENPNYNKDRLPLGFFAATGYGRRYPCPAGASQLAVDVPVQAEKFTVREYKKLFAELTPAPSEARVTLINFALGFRDGIESMQIRTSATEYYICFPEERLRAATRVLLAIGQDLRLRRDYWADKQDWSVGVAAMVALKQPNPCKR